MVDLQQRGLSINPDPGNRNFGTQAGAAISVTEALTLGGEIFIKRVSSTGGPGSVGFPLGGKMPPVQLRRHLRYQRHLPCIVFIRRGLENMSASNLFHII